MKIILLIPVLMLLMFASCHDEHGMLEAFSKYKYKDGVTTITIPGWPDVWVTLIMMNDNYLKALIKLK